MSVTFRFAAMGEYPTISKFLDEFWAKDHIYCRNQKLFDWTFHRSSHWPAEQYSFSIAEDGGELAGILGGIPFTFNHFGETSRGMWIVNYVVRPDHRKGPAALQLLSTFRRPDIEPVIAFGITQPTTVIYRVLRGRVLPSMPRSFLLLPEMTERFRKLLSIANPAWDERQSAAVTATLAREIKIASNTGAAHGLPAGWDQNDWPIIAKTTIGAVRDEAYLNWRYKEHPVFEYRFLSIPEGGRNGLLVWRLETIRKKTETGREDVDRIGRLVEFLPVSESNAARLAAALVQELRSNDAIGADYYGFHGETRQWLLANGFASLEGNPNGSLVPTRFQPLDGKTGEILSAMFVSGPLPECTTAVDCPWYWTKSDSDQDRPN